MSVWLGKDLVVEHRTMMNETVQYLVFTYVIISGHRKLAISERYGGSIRHGNHCSSPSQTGARF